MRYIQKRDIVVWIIISIVTCGIGGLIWLYNINEDMNAVCDDGFNVQGWLVLVLYLVCCHFYLIYWSYKMGQRLDAWHNYSTSRAVLFLILSIFGLDIVVWALLQDELNMKVDENTAA